MVLSPAERAFIHDGLVAKTVSRADSRHANQYRPLKASCSILPSSNGSSRIYTADGIECITSIKARVVREQELEKLVNIDMEIQGERDDTVITTHTITMLRTALLNTIEPALLRITDKYYFQLNIDVAVLATPDDFQSSTYTLQSMVELVSMGVYLALKATRVPKLTSEDHEGDIEEEPTFNDDWDMAQDLIPRDVRPILLFVVGIAGPNVIIDPSLEEQQVLDHGVCMGFHAGAVVAPIQSLVLSSDSTSGVNHRALAGAMDLVRAIGPSVVEALDSIAAQEVDAFELAL